MIRPGLLTVSWMASGAKPLNETLSNLVSAPALMVSGAPFSTRPLTFTPVTMNRFSAAPTMSGSAPSVTLVMSCPPTMSGCPFNSSRAPGASVSVPVVVSGAERVMRPAITRLENTPAAVLPLPVSTVWPRPTIVRPASALLVTVSVKPFVSSVAPGSRNRSRTVTFAVSLGTTEVAAEK